MLPAAAGIGGGLQVAGNFQQALEGGFVLGVFVHHHAHGHGGSAAGTLFEHREEDALFLHHVAEQLVLDGVQQGNHLGREFACVHAGHFFGQGDEFFQLAAVGIVVARQDVVDDVAVGGALPKFVINHECDVLSVL